MAKVKGRAVLVLVAVVAAAAGAWYFFIGRKTPGGIGAVLRAAVGGQSPEEKVRGWYVKYLGRDPEGDAKSRPDGGQYKGWVPQFASLGEAEVERRIANSTEAARFKATGKVDAAFAK